MGDESRTLCQDYFTCLLTIGELYGPWYPYLYSPDTGISYIVTFKYARFSLRLQIPNSKTTQCLNLINELLNRHSFSLEEPLTRGH